MEKLKYIVICVTVLLLSVIGLICPVMIMVAAAIIAIVIVMAVVSYILSKND